MSQSDPIVTQLVNSLLNKSAVVIATDTVYGILSIDESLIIRAKKRFDPNKKTIRFVRDKSQIPGKIPEQLKKIIDKYWPGELTIIYEGIGYRCPNNYYILETLKQLNQFIYASSANISNQPTAKNIKEAKKIFKDCGIPIQFIETPKKILSSEKPSTVYDYDKKEVLREGTIKKEDILKFISA